MEDHGNLRQGQSVFLNVDVEDDEEGDHPGNLRPGQSVFLDVDTEVIFKGIICQKVVKALMELLPYLQICKFIVKIIKSGKIIVMLEKAIIEVVTRWGRRNSWGGQPGDLMWIWRMLANPTLPPTLSGSR